VSAETDVRHEWGVVGPEGRMWTYESEVVARTVAREQQKHLYHRTVTRSSWERVTPPAVTEPGVAS
jgi:hypothetical protein